MKKSEIIAKTAAAVIGLNRKKRVVKWLQPYYKQGKRWYKLPVRKGI